jgi:hypothetical protein
MAKSNAKLRRIGQKLDMGAPNFQPASQEDAWKLTFSAYYYK